MARTQDQHTLVGDAVDAIKNLPSVQYTCRQMFSRHFFALKVSEVEDFSLSTPEAGRLVLLVYTLYKDPSRYHGRQMFLLRARTPIIMELQQPLRHWNIIRKRGDVRYHTPWNQFSKLDFSFFHSRKSGSADNGVVEAILSRDFGKRIVLLVHPPRCGVIRL